MSHIDVEAVKRTWDKERANFVQTLDLKLEDVRTRIRTDAHAVHRDGRQRHRCDPRRRDRQPMRHGILRRAGIDLRARPEHGDSVPPSCNFLAARPPHDLIADAIVLKSGRRICYGEVHVRSGDRLVAHATLSFIILPGEWPDHGAPPLPGGEGNA